LSLAPIMLNLHMYEKYMFYIVDFEDK